MSAEFSELVESTVCVAQPAPRWQQVTGDWSASKIPDTFIPVSLSIRNNNKKMLSQATFLFSQ